jgi:hypothetical protein
VAPSKYTLNSKGFRDDVAERLLASKKSAGNRDAAGRSTSMDLSEVKQPGFLTLAARSFPTRTEGSAVLPRPKSVRLAG